MQRKGLVVGLTLLVRQLAAFVRALDPQNLTMREFCGDSQRPITPRTRFKIKRRDVSA
jgi:hypothetical protein